MKLTIAALLLSPVFASKAAKLAKFSKAKAAKSAGYGSMSASMSVGPEPPITPKGCGESFTNEKVVLSDNLNCGSLGEGDPQQDCAVTLDGPLAELNCKDYTLSQIAKSPNYLDGPYGIGICLKNGAKTINCNVQQFKFGIDVRNGGEVVNSNLGSNNVGMYADFKEDATLTIENTDASNTGSTGLYIGVDGDGINAELIVKGQVTANSNENDGIFISLSNNNLEVELESGATLTTCGNKRYDIFGNVFAPATATFLGTGYTCDQTKVVFNGDGTVVENPVCQRCTCT